MKAVEAQLLDFIRKSTQFAIPIYQRTYSWTERECRQLWDDIIRSGENEKISSHFIGSIVYIDKGGPLTRPLPMIVIDGQQRLTTITLLVAALEKTLLRNHHDSYEPVEGFSPLKLRHYYLTNQVEKDERHYKLLLSQTDKDSLIAIVGKKEQPKDFSKRIVENHKLFVSWIAEMKVDLSTLCRGIAKLAVVDIALSRDQDNPQLIFESMNSTGRELTQADLIRNFILMGLEPELQTRLYENYWRPMETCFGQAAYNTYFDGFMRHYLTVQTGDIPRMDAVYDAFKSYSRSPNVAEAGVEALVADIREYSRYFCAMALDAEADSDLSIAFQDLRELKVDVAYPLLLELYADYVKGVLQKPDFLEAVRLIEAYVFRRAICAIPTNSLNKTFATFSKVLKKDRYLESIQAHLLLLPSYRRFPSDVEFKRELQVRDLYNFRSRSYWLRRLENHGRKERVGVSEYTIEHIMPQNKDLSKDWKEALGAEWERIHETWLHTLGNLTLTGYNSEYSDRSFQDKRDMQGGFRESPLKLNKGLGKLEKWDEESINGRGQSLSEEALSVWRAPQLTPDILNAYRPRVESTSTYSIEDHPFLLNSPTRELFEPLRKEVLALDPVVSEDFLKFYVAYKAETNFVDVIPQAKRLRLSINIPFGEINDPQGICKDVTNLSKWGNGDVEIIFDDLDQLPYIMGFIRQSFERQMGNGEVH